MQYLFKSALFEDYNFKPTTINYSASFFISLYFFAKSKQGHIN